MLWLVGLSTQFSPTAKTSVPALTKIQYCIFINNLEFIYLRKWIMGESKIRVLYQNPLGIDPVQGHIMILSRWDIDSAGTWFVKDKVKGWSVHTRVCIVTQRRDRTPESRSFSLSQFFLLEGNMGLLSGLGSTLGGLEKSMTAPGPANENAAANAGKDLHYSRASKWATIIMGYN